MARTLFALVTFLILAGCTTLKPKRTELPLQGQPIDCNAIKGKVSTLCANQIVEVAHDYRLHFVEFDDQGRPYGDIPKFGEATHQIDEFFKTVRNGVSGPQSKNGISVVVFAHGWLHSSSTDDPNLIDFRELLGQLSIIEKKAFCARTVVGLYVGWRGAGTLIGQHPFEIPTFWSRKLAAEQIAAGTFQQVLGGLKAIQSNTPERLNLSRGPTDPDCSSRLKTTYVGQSFGGLIVMSSMSQDFVRSLMLDRERLPNELPEASRKGRTSPDEMVIAINPAMEGARFDALFRVARDMKPPLYRSPRLVVITSQNDWATGTLFPMGRSLNTLTKRYPEGDKLGRRSARVAVGHDPQYLTRELVTSSQYTPQETDQVINSHECDRWHAADDYEKRAVIDIERAQAFYQSVNGDYDANEMIGEDGDGRNKKFRYWPRLFCAIKTSAADDSGILVMRDYGDAINRNVPIWNIRTRKPIVDSHGDINNIRLVEFLRQIYVDSMFFP